MKKPIFWLIGCIIADSLHAQTQVEQGMSVGLEVTPTDNVYQVVGNPESDTEVTIQVGANLQTGNQVHEFNLDYQGKSSDYLDNSFSRTHSLNGTARLDLFTPSRTFGLFVSNDEQETIIDVVGPDTPDNQSQRHLSQAGPILNFRLDATDVIQLAQVYSSTYIENSQADSEAVSTFAKWAHRLDSGTTFSLRGERTTVEPEIFVVENYTQESIGVELSKRILYGNATLYVGNSVIDDVVSLDGEELDSDVYDVLINFSINGSELAISAVKNLQGSGGNGYYSDTSFDVGSELFTIELNKRELASLSIPLRGGQSFLGLDYSAIKVVDVLEGGVRKFGTSAVSYSQSLANNQQLTFRYAVTDNYTSSDQGESEYERNRYSFTYRKDLGEKLNMSCGIVKSEIIYSYVGGIANINAGFCSLNYRVF